MGALSGADTSSVIAVNQNLLGLGVVSRSPKKIGEIIEALL